MTRRTATLLALDALFALAACSAAVSPPSPVTIGAILGQSNAVGQGASALRPPMPDVHWREHSEAPDWTVERDEWGPLETRPNGAFGPEFGLAKAAGPGAYLEKYAINGTPLAPNDKRPAWLPSANDIYPQALAFLAKAAPPDFVLWWQGEADTMALDSAKEYGANLEQLTSALREDLGAPELVFVAVRVRPNMPYPFMYEAEERASLGGWASSLNRVVEVDDLPVGADGVHYGNDALDEAGRRAWEVYMGL